jgi:outer membrane receptor protein involved in Fe transport
MADFLTILNTPISVASRTPTTFWKVPGIITLLTREEILDTGAKDLQDLLRLVPGFEVTSDTQGNLTLSVRGNWGNNGKVLIRVDGFDQNDLLFGSLFLANSFPLENVQRIEIIRGPGSVMYGGFGEIAVVNLLTRNGRELRGAAASYDHGTTTESYAHRNWFAGYGDSAGGLDYSVAWYGRNGNRSDRTFVFRDPNVQPPRLPVVDLTHQSKLDDSQANLAISYRGWNLRYLEDHVKLNDPNNFANLGFNPELQFNHKAASLGYTFRMGESLSLSPELVWRQSNPWFYLHQVGIRKFIVDRTTLKIPAAWAASPALQFVFGYEGTHDLARKRGSFQPLWTRNGKPEIGYTNHAVYIEASLKSALADVTLGGRLDRHSASGSAFAPRFALTRSFGSNHLKVLAARAFRSPAIAQIDATRSVKYESANTYEVEYGRQISPTVLATLNAFDIRIYNPYYFDYIEKTSLSGGRVHTRGLEGTLRLVGKFGYLTTTVSTYQMVENTVSAYGVPLTSAGQPRDRNSLEGTSRLKGTLAGKFWISPRLSFAPSLVAIGSRWGQPETDPNLNSSANPPTAIRRPGDTVIDAFFHYEWPRPRLLLSFGYHNLTDTDHDYVQGIVRNLAVLPGASREFTMRAVYNF